MTPVTTWDPDTLLPNLRAYLIGQGIVRDPKASGTAHPMWLDPKLGMPYPGQTENVGRYGMDPDLVLAAYPTTGIPSGPLMGFYLQSNVTIYYRGRTSPLIQGMHTQIRGVLHDKRNYNMNGLQVNQSLLSRELQRISSDEEGYVYNTELVFDLFDPTQP